VLFTVGPLLHPSGSIVRSKIFQSWRASAISRQFSKKLLQSSSLSIRHIKDQMTEMKRVWKVISQRQSDSSEPVTSRVRPANCYDPYEPIPMIRQVSLNFSYYTHPVKYNKTRSTF